MTDSELMNRLEDESARRKKDIVDLIDAIAAVSEPVRDAVLRACVVLLFAHLEGFLKKSSRLLLEFLEERKLAPQGLHSEWLEGKSIVNIARLREIVWCLRMDHAPFERREEFVKVRGRRRNIIAHGGGEDLAIDMAEIQAMADGVLEIMEEFKDQIIRLVENHRPE